MEVRKIRPEEKIKASLVCTEAYFEKESANYAERMNNPLDHSEGYENTWASFDEHGEPRARLRIEPYKMMLDGHAVNMAGVAGVATAPSARRGGMVRGLFEKCMPDMRAQGQIYSYLFPFSHIFYQKFGYAVCNVVNRATVTMSALQAYPYPRNIQLFTRDESVTDFLSVYNAYIQNKNLSIIRDEEAMRGVLGNDPYVSREYAYLHCDDDGNPDAYVIFWPDTGNDPSMLVVRELAWTTPAGLHAMFGFMGGFYPQLKMVRWDVPSDINLYALIPECYEVRVSHRCAGMGRIVDAPGALALLKAPCASGRVTIGVTDVFLPCNTGVYALSWESGVVTVSTTDKVPDMETDIETLTQLAVGFLTPAEAQHKRGTVIHGNERNLQSLFPKKPLYMMEDF